MAEGNELGLPAGQLVGHISDVLTGSAQSLLEVRLDAVPATGAANIADTVHANSGDSPQEENPANPVAGTRTGQYATALVPFVEPLVPTVDLTEHNVLINPPPGLIEFPQA